MCADTRISIDNFQEFCDWVDSRDLTSEHGSRLKAYFNKNFLGQVFNNPVELMNYIKNKGLDVNNLIKTVRNYLNYCEQADRVPIEVLTKYRKVLKLRKARTDFHVPSDEDIIKGYGLIKDHKGLEIVFSVLLTSGVRYGEAITFLETYDISKFKVYDKYAVYVMALDRGTKNINNIYITRSVYDRLFHLENSRKALKTRLKEKGCPFTWKYLRKWQYNFLIYNGVPESVADFIQGRANRSVSSSHYLARSQQADFWYEKIIEKLDKVYCSTNGCLI